MVWQDIVIAVSSVLFSYSLAYQVYVGFKHKKGNVALQTSLLTALGNYAIAFALFSLNLIFSTIVAAFNSTMWTILFIQGMLYKH